MSLLNFYQNLPSHLNPIAFKIGFFPIGWYSLMYLAGFLTVYVLLRWRAKKDFFEIDFSIEKIETFILYSIFGLVLGGRLGYVFFYEPLYFLSHPLELFFPFDSSWNFIGIYGMSYHGGVIGILLSSYIFSRKNKINFWKLADFVIPAIPAGYFFGRVGNFINGELFGRITQNHWGMYFFNSNTLSWELRFPSQLLEAFFEGIFLFLILWIWRNKKQFQGKFLEIYLFGYGIVRFFVEFFREPDWQIGFIGEVFGQKITLGQVYCLIMIGLAILTYSIRRILNKNRK